jgi:hypothetical protein
VFFFEQTPDAVIEAVQTLERVTFDANQIRARARTFDKSRFRSEIIDFVAACWESKARTESPVRHKEFAASSSHND